MYRLVETRESVACSSVLSGERVRVSFGNRSPLTTLTLSQTFRFPEIKLLSGCERDSGQIFFNAILRFTCSIEKIQFSGTTVQR